MEDDVLSALPDDSAADLLKMLDSGGHGKEVISSQLAHLAGEAGWTVWEQDLGL